MADNPKRDHKDWHHYWDDVAPRLNKYVESNRIADAERYIEGCFGLFSFVQEDIKDKLTKNKEYASCLYPMMIELQDLLRGSLVCQVNLLLASSVLTMRTTFEIYCNLMYITRNKDSAKMAGLFDKYKDVERYIHAEDSPTMRLPEEERRRIESKCKEWFYTKKGKTRIIKHWTANQEMNLKRMTEELDQWDARTPFFPGRPINLREQYTILYGAGSKFTHGSPLIWNLYRQEKGVGSIPHPHQHTRMNLLSAHTAMRAMEEFCIHFGVGFPDYDYALISQAFLKLEPTLGERSQ